LFRHVRQQPTPLQAKWGQPVVIENKPGAGSSLGMDAVAKAAPDGYTVGLGNIGANAINPAVWPAGYPYQPVANSRRSRWSA